MGGGVFDLSNGSSRQLWEILLLWNGGRREEIFGLFWSNDVDAVNEQAVALWPGLASSMPCGDGMAGMDCEQNVDGSRTRKGEPYQGFACLGHGQASVMIIVSRVVSCSARSYGANLVKRALASRSLSKAGSREEQARRLLDHVLYASENKHLQTGWRCIHQDGVDVRLEIGFNAPRHCMQGPTMNEVVRASEERVGSEGIRFLRLADGSGWVPTSDPQGQMLFTREDAKYIRIKFEQPCQWSEAGLLSSTRSNAVRPCLVLEAYVEGANGERREVPAFSRRPPWQLRVDDMDFPLTLTLIEPGSSEAAAPSSQSPPEPEATSVSTPQRPPTATEAKDPGSGQKESRGTMPSEREAPLKKRRLRRKGPAPAAFQALATP
mmetsp:Transcript_56439/g.165012  ORF Transcript_56439/g.165012 Transcript_56439/m.165012 type:complete len:379 (+) Transcript_56439:81-1217(+)